MSLHVYQTFETAQFVSKLRNYDMDSWLEFQYTYNLEIGDYIKNAILENELLFCVYQYSHELQTDIISKIWMTAKERIQKMEFNNESDLEEWLFRICEEVTAKSLSVYENVGMPEFIHLLKKRDNIAWEKLAYDYRSMLMNVARSKLTVLGKSHYVDEAEDLFQIAMTTALKNIHKLELSDTDPNPKALPAWLTQIQIYVTMNFYRRLRYRDHLSLQALVDGNYEDLIPAESSLDTLDKEILEAYYDAVAQITDNVQNLFKNTMSDDDIRSVIIHRFIYFETPKSITTELGIDISKVRYISRRAKLFLKRALAQLLESDEDDDEADRNSSKLNNTGE